MAHDEAPTPKQNVVLIQFIEYGTTPPTIPSSFSGTLYLSGGALCYRSAAGTHTQVGAP